MYPIRVLHVVGIMNRGGLETLLMNIYRKIDRTKIQFDFLVHQDQKGVFDDEIKSLGGQIYKVDYVTKVGHFRYLKNLDEFFNKHKEYKIVHSHMDAMSGIILSRAKKAHIPVRIAHSHNAYPKMGKFERIYKNYSRFLVNGSCTEKFACSTMASEWLFGKKENIKILHNAIDVEKFKFNRAVRMAKRKEFGIGEDDFVIGNIARFNIQKNHSFIVDIFDELIKQNKNIKLVLVGDGVLREQIKNKVKVLNLSNRVQFLGVREDINEIVQIFDLMLLPSLHEGLGIVLIESQTSGLNCVVSKAIPNDADMKCGLMNFISLKNNAKTWAKNINRIIESICKEERYSRDNEVKRNGYEIRDVCDWITSFYQAKYMDLLNR